MSTDHNKTRNSMHRIFIFLLIFLNLGLLSAQNTRKGFKLLEKSEYDKAYEVFTSVLEDQPDPAASFGLALILADDNSPRFDLINAWSFASKTNENLDKIAPEALEFIGEYFANTEVRNISRPVKKKIEYAVETIEAKLIKYIREENNLEIVYAVLEKFPDFKYRENVIHIRNQLEFRKYEKQNTLEAYLEFLKKFPDAAQVDKAIRYRDRLAFEKTRQVNTVEAYKKYLVTYPKSLEFSQATKFLYAAAFELAKEVNTIQAFDEFMKSYPDALEISEARLLQKQLLYEYAKKIQTLESYNEFIRRYPEGQQYVDIFNLKSLDFGMKSLATMSFPSNNIQWARSFDEEEAEELSSSLAIDSMNAYILGGTVFRADTGFSDVWLIKTNAEGKMLWNKHVGEEYNDQLNLLTINSGNQILGIGYTWLGLDSATRESWIFKLGKDGQKLWTRKLGSIHINCLLNTHEGTLYLGGYQKTDSSDLYAVIALNENGKRLWNRTYTGHGQVTGLTKISDGSIVLTGNHWRARLDPKGYLKWEAPFNSADSIMVSTGLAKGDMLYFGIRNRQKLVVIKTNLDNKILLEKEYTPVEIPFSLKSIVQVSQNQAIALAGYASHQSILWINMLNGEIQKSLVVPTNLKISDIQKDLQGNLLIVAFTGQVFLLKNSGFSF